MSGTTSTANLSEARTASDLAEFCGWQDDGNGGGFALWNLKRDIPGHPKGSTVAAQTISRFLAQISPATK